MINAKKVILFLYKKFILIKLKYFYSYDIFFAFLWWFFYSYDRLFLHLYAGFFRLINDLYIFNVFNDLYKWIF